MNHIQSPDNSDSGIEREIQAKGLTAPRITPADIKANIQCEITFTVGNAANALKIPTSAETHLLTICVLTMKNGFTVVGKSACASPENFDADLGAKIARNDAINQVWPLMGYELRSHLSSERAQPKAQTFKDHVLSESAELDERITKLSAFIVTDTFDGLPLDERNRLSAQLAAMDDYSNCLHERIKAFTD